MENRKIKQIVINGEPFDVEGKDAYEIAKELGQPHTDTVEEWLESLKGEKGEKGEDANITNLAQTLGNGEDVAISQKAVTDELYKKADLVWEVGGISGSTGIDDNVATNVCRAIGYLDVRSIAFVTTNGIHPKMLFAYDKDYHYLCNATLPKNTTWTNADIFALNDNIKYIRIRSNWDENTESVVGTVTVLIDKHKQHTIEQVDSLDEQNSNYIFQEKEMSWEYGWRNGDTGEINDIIVKYAAVNTEKILVTDFKELTIDAGAYDDEGNIGPFYVKCFAHDKAGNLVGIINMSSTGNYGFGREDVKAISANAYYFNVLVTRDSQTRISLNKVRERVHILCALSDNRLTVVEKQLDKQEYWIKQRRRFSDKPIMVAYSHGANLGKINTELAYINAAKTGFEWLKADVQPTSDGKFIMCHDSGFTFDGNGYITDYNASKNTLIKDMTYAQCMLKEYAVTYAISTGGVVYRPKVCDLEQFLTVCREFGCRPYIVIRDWRYIILGKKADGTVDESAGKRLADKYVAELLRLLDKYDFTENCIVNSFTLDSVKMVAEASNHRVMISTVTGYDKDNTPTIEDIDNIMAASPNCTINFFANLSEGWDNEALMDASQEVINYAKSLGVVVGTSSVTEPHGVLKRGVGLCQCQCPCIETKVTPIALCIQLLNGVASAVVWNGMGAKYTADVSISGKTLIVQNIRIRDTSRDFPDGVTPNLAGIYPYTLTAESRNEADVKVTSVGLAYNCYIEIGLDKTLAEIDTTSAKRIFVKFVYGI